MLYVSCLCDLPGGGRTFAHAQQTERDWSCTVRHRQAHVEHNSHSHSHNHNRTVTTTTARSTDAITHHNHNLPASATICVHHNTHTAKRQAHARHGTRCTAFDTHPPHRAHPSCIYYLVLAHVRSKTLLVRFSFSLSLSLSLCLSLSFSFPFFLSPACSCVCYYVPLIEQQPYQQHDEHNELEGMHMLKQHASGACVTAWSSRTYASRIPCMMMSQRTCVRSSCSCTC